MSNQPHSHRVSKQLNVGCNFASHIDILISAVKQAESEVFGSKLAEVYGSPRGVNPFGSVRPSRRESDSSFAEFVMNSEKLHNAGIKINLTLNSLFPHHKLSGRNSDIFDDLAARTMFKQFIQKASPYVDGWIIAHPYVIDLLHKLDLETSIAISTIMNVHSLGQMHTIKRRWPQVKKVCPALWKNRDFPWLTEANKIIPLELLANEFCSIGGQECEGLYRQACYLSQSMETKNWNPMDVCIKERQEHPEAWLMARFILPQWMASYKERTGVNHFKITGRTHSDAFIKRISREYIQEKATGNLLGLWGQLEATLGKGEQNTEHAKALGIANIPIEEIERMIYTITCCTSDECGVSCHYCKHLYDKITSTTKGNSNA